jgi:membrane protease YdiL (CAAX protease family)
MKTGEAKRSPAGNGGARIAASAEVLVAFTVVHVGYRAVKHFTELGRLEGAARLNFTPGVVMILFTVSVLLICRRSFQDYGLSLVRWAENLKLGLLWGLLLVAGAALLALAGVRHRPGGPPPGMAAGVAYGLACCGAVVLFGWLLRRQQTIFHRIPVAFCLLPLTSVLCLPLVLASRYGRPFVHTMLTVLWLVLGAACGEEIFYRGYIQSRINGAFRRPFEFPGVRFGAGLLVSALLFGFLRALNSVDYFQGRLTFAWGLGVANVGTGLLYGCLRESTGSVLAGAVTHAVLDVLVIVPGLISGA